MAAKNKTARAVTVVILLLASIGIIISIVNFSKTEKAGQPKVGQAASDFTQVGINDKKISLHDLQGKVVLLNFWGSWCEPCRQEMPMIEKTYEKYKDQGLIVIGVNIGESKVTAKGFAERMGLTFPILLDQKRDVTLKQYIVDQIPSSFFIDKHGVIRYVFTGPMNQDYIEKNVKSLLSQP